MMDLDKKLGLKYNSIQQDPTRFRKTQKSCDKNKRFIEGALAIASAIGMIVTGIGKLSDK